MRDTAIVARRLHPVMVAQRVIAPGLRSRASVSRLRNAAERLLRCSRGATKGPQRVLQPLGKCHVAFCRRGSHGHRSPSRSAGSGRADDRAVFTGDGNAPRSAMSVNPGLAHPAGLMHLAEDHLLVRSVSCPPGADAAFHSPPNACGQTGVASLHLFEDGDRPQPRCGLQHRHDLGLEKISQRVRTAAATDLLMIVTANSRDRV